ncbi:hypothetical protein E0L36_19125 [Streptomyces sp. AJS327]|uniref:hypothetical protein n=1 Tax=Streptomyces sp. AJS327 TaxID=2545265 RepID=UPI0015DF2B48|nr:hypothetical protein [Streptomyces sp. AJS327]MBA0052909.1 hypothetical protein [Streptomyces sp. AJS327]
METESTDRTSPPAGLRVVVVTGAPGVGKTRLAHQLVARYAVPAAAIDCDPVVYPWQSTESLYALMADTLRASIPVYRDWGSRVIVISGVVLAGRALEPLRAVFEELGADWVCYGLRATPDALAARIRRDAGSEHYVEGRLAESFLDAEVPGVPGVREIDTSALSATEVADAVVAAERGQLGPGWVLPDGATARAEAPAPGGAATPGATVPAPSGAAEDAGRAAGPG